MTDGRFDPLDVPGPLSLLGRHRAIALVAVRGGFVLWHYDPANRIHTPATTIHATAGEVLDVAAIYLLDKTDVRAELEAALALARAREEFAEKGPTA